MYICKRVLKAGLKGSVLVTVLQAQSMITLSSASYGDEEKQDNLLSELVVFAERRQTNMITTPVSMNVLGENDLLRLNLQEASDILSQYPNLTTNASNAANMGFTIRGVGTSNFHGNVARAVGVYVDEVSHNGPFSGMLPLFDLSRVEVLRGPQNTLYGRNTTGGAVNYYSIKPQLDEFSGRLVTRAGNYNRYSVEGGLNVPIGETIALRLSGLYRDEEGVFNNTIRNEKLGGMQQTGLRAQLLWSPSDQWTVLFNGHYSENDAANRGIRANGIGDPIDPTQPCPDDIGDFTRVTNCVIATGFNPSNADYHSINMVVSPRQYYQNKGGYARIGYQFDGGANLSFISAYEDTSFELSEDNGGANVLIFNPNQNADFEQFSQELRLQSAEHAWGNWQLGLFYFKEDLLQSTITRRDANPATPPGPGPNAEVISYNQLDQRDEDFSIYGKLDYNIDDRLSVYGGLRFTHNKKSATSDFGVFVAPLALNDPADYLTTSGLNQLIIDGASDPRVVAVAVPNFQLTPEQDTSKIGGKFGVKYALSDEHVIFTQYSRGFKSGGFDTRALAALNGDAGIPVKPEYVDVLEAGYKASMYDNTWRFNGSVFYSLWHDMQIFAVSNGVPAFLNVPQSRIMGAEAEVQSSTEEGWFGVFGAGLMDSKITDIGTLIGITEGHDLSNVPLLSANLRMGKASQFDLGELIIDFSFSHTGKRYEGVNAAKDLAETKAGIYVLSTSMSFEFSTLPLMVTASLENLTKEQYCLEKRLLDNPTQGAVPGALSGTVNCTPSDGVRYLGLSLSYQF